eukprot:TRINITY_DN13363_c0_g1_i1.p1 TRINITY_DN13363_c0_g1~~TRINITY_DN13363_c0_g1_i1.p1  ORF type:complete len:265 (-),score=80.81 TRINITY_DN13363_c0_g1_i1:597-1391(-)
MASFKLLGEENKILRRKEKEAERQKKIQEHIQQVSQGPGVSSWADASDEEDEDAKIFKPVSDSESSASESDSEVKGDQRGNVDKDKDSSGPAANASDIASKAAADAKALPKQKKDKKKDSKQAKVPAEEEDLDEVLAEFGINIGAPAEKTEELAASRRRRKKEKESGDGDASTKADSKPTDTGTKNALVSEEAITGEVAQEGAVNEEPEVVDAEARKSALEALKKKQGAKKNSSSSSAAKCALAEAKKKASEKKVKRDKSMYDR